jgi:hypothetical protein
MIAVRERTHDDGNRTLTTLRIVPHSGVTVVGDVPLKLLTVHVVDKNKPLYVWVN